MLSRTGNVFWNNKERAAEIRLYAELAQRGWSASSFLIEEDKTEWLRIDFNKRSDIVKGFLVANTIKQAFGSIFLPFLNTSIDIEDITKRAIISRIESTLNGEHSQLNSKIICELNSKTLVQKLSEDIKESKQLKDVFTKLEVIFKGMCGWNSAYENGLQMEGVDLFQQVNIHIWRASAIATILLESAESLSLVSLFLALEEGAVLPEVLRGVQTMAIDMSIISTYLSIIAEDSYKLLTKENQKENEKWLIEMTDAYFKAPWNNSLDKSSISEDSKEISSKLVEYNLNKSLVKFGFYPKEKVKGMPNLVEKYLEVDIDYWIKKGKDKVYKEQNWKEKWWK